MTKAEQLLQELQEVKMQSSVLMFSGIDPEEMASKQKAERISIIERYFEDIRSDVRKVYS